MAIVLYRKHVLKLLEINSSEANGRVFCIIIIIPEILSKLNFCYNGISSWKNEKFTQKPDLCMQISTLLILSALLAKIINLLTLSS